MVGKVSCLPNLEVAALPVLFCREGEGARPRLRRPRVLRPHVLAGGADVGPARRVGGALSRHQQQEEGRQGGWLGGHDLDSQEEFPTNIGIARGMLSVATLVVVSDGG